MCIQWYKTSLRDSDCSKQSYQLAAEPAAQVAILAFSNLISEPSCCWKSVDVHLFRQCFHSGAQIVPNAVERGGNIERGERRPDGFQS